MGIVEHQRDGFDARSASQRFTGRACGGQTQGAGSGSQAPHIGTVVAIEKDQERLRANLREMPNTAKAYKRYLEKFDTQETEIEKFQAEVKKLDAAAHSQDKALQDFVAAFSAE